MRGRWGQGRGALTFAVVVQVRVLDRDAAEDAPHDARRALRVARAAQDVELVDAAEVGRALGPEDRDAHVVGAGAAGPDEDAVGQGHHHGANLAHEPGRAPVAWLAPLAPLGGLLLVDFQRLEERVVDDGGAVAALVVVQALQRRVLGCGFGRREDPVGRGAVQGLDHLRDALAELQLDLAL